MTTACLTRPRTAPTPDRTTPRTERPSVVAGRDDLCWLGLSAGARHDPLGPLARMALVTDHPDADLSGWVA